MSEREGPVVSVTVFVAGVGVGLVWAFTSILVALGVGRWISQGWRGVEDDREWQEFVLAHMSDPDVEEE